VSAVAPLDEYQRKRDFATTPEPAGATDAGSGSGGSPLSFVIHKHAARRLHYDLRLELDGVLLSWAVPKGPSLDPGDKRLAVHVEDHPLEYGIFEGVIPAGEYGAGAVIVWDRGTWEPLVDPHEGLEHGNLKFAMAGEKLRGAFVLVRMKPKPGERGENWLLIKERDGEVRPRDEYDVLVARPESVASGRTIEQVASSGMEAGGAPAGEPASIPDDAPFQLATLSAAPPEGPGWVHEIKYDGYRVRLAVEGGAARVLTRGGEEWSDRMGALARAAAALPVTSALLDGEAVVFGEGGSPDFGALQSALSDRRDDLLTYLAFDLLYVDGRDLRAEPLARRKKILEDLLERAPAGPIRYAEHVGGSGNEFLAASCSLALEGAVSKRADAPYRAGRTAEWRKTKCRSRQEFVVGGFTGPRGSRSGFGSLLLGYYDDSGTMRYAGRAGSGLSSHDLDVLAARLEPLLVDEPPFADPPRISDRAIRWVRPEVVVEIEFAEWTSSGVLRQPVFLGTRDDRDPATVRREDLDDPPDPVLDDDGARPRLTNPDKALFEPGPTDTLPVTKSALAAYYETVAAAMLPHVADRPLSVVRCPHGREAQCFFQKHPDPRSFPAELRVIEVTERTGPASYFAVDDVNGLLALVQLGVTEIHAWNSLSGDPERPDRVVFDLDPGPGVEWPGVIAAARTVRDALAALGLTAFVRTTGGHGLHVVTPIVPEHGYNTVRGFARGLVDRLAESSPERFTARMAKAARPGKVFIDYLRNAHGATAIASYSTRARPGAPVAVPITWEELAEELDPLAFDTLSVPVRLSAAGSHDPWDGYDATRASLEPAILEAVGFTVQSRLDDTGGSD
jgi:bifunctional non-homologous end joining protein LigD